MGFLGDVANRIREYFVRDKSQVGIQMAKGATASGYPTSGYDLLQAYGYDVLSDFLRLEHDLLSRYIDYEEMDDYPEIAAAIDIFADDASQPETHLNRTLWVTSKDSTLQTILDDLFHRTLRMDEEIWEIARTVVKYGNDYEEILVTGEGVKGLNFLAPPTVRRIEGPRGELYGFVQDFKGRFGYSPAEFQQIMANRAALRQGGPHMAGGYGANPRVTALEDWEVVHFRLRGKHRRSIYGYCLAGSSRVWTTDGIKEIKNIRPGDRVLTRQAGRLLSTRVLDQVCSGTKPIYSLRTPHREVWLTAEHPVLVDRGGKNNAWVPAGELNIGDKIVVAAKMPELRNPPAFGLHLLEMNDDALVRLTSRGIEALRSAVRVQKYGPRAEGLVPTAEALGISRGQLTELVSGGSGVTLATAKKLFASCELPFFDGAVERRRDDERITLPDFVEPWVARLWGFLLGDGWLTEGQVYFALGTDEDLNRFYESLLARTGLPVSRLKDDHGVERQAYVSSKTLVGLMRRLGWTDGAHGKRVPSWIFNLSVEFRKEFIAGFHDADGWDTYGGRYKNTELCNHDLLRDLKNLVDGLGWTSGQTRQREARTSTLNSGKQIHSGRQWLLTYHETELAAGEEFTSEEVIGFDPIGEEPVYDIEVASSGHCFIADGVVVHNSVLEPARWIWKRLMLLEDAALIYRLQRAPERYAFYVDIGDLPPNEALAYLNRVRQQHRKKKWVNPTTGKLDLKFDPMSQDEDFFIPVRQGAEGTRIEVLGAPSWQHMEDIEYFRDKLFAAIKIPKAYLAQHEGMNRNILSSEDVRFARTVLRIQREMRNGMNKIARVHLAALNIDPLEAEYDIRLTVPSAIFELAQIEVKNARADLAGRMREFVSLHWIMSNVFGMSDREIETIFKERDEDAERDAYTQANTQAIIQKAVAQAGIEGQTLGQIGAQAMQTAATPPQPPAPEVDANGQPIAAPAPGAQPGAAPAQAPAGGTSNPQESRFSGPLIQIKPSTPPRRLYGREQMLFEGKNRETEKRAHEKLDRLLKGDRLAAGRLHELGEMLRELNMAVGSRRR